VEAVRVLHQTPGRLRLRLPDRADPREVVAALEGQPGVLSWRWNQRTRSLVLAYDERATSGETLLGIACGGRSDIEDGIPPVPRPARPPALAVAISQGLAELDRSVARATCGLVNLRLLFPLALFGWALRELGRGAVGPLAWSSALWYAHGLFRDYNLPEHDA
jgi:hypothetical protein